MERLIKNYFNDTINLMKAITITIGKDPGDQFICHYILDVLIKEREIK